MIKFIKNVMHNGIVYKKDDVVETIDASLINEGFAVIVTEQAEPQEPVNEENKETLEDIQNKLNEPQKTVESSGEPTNEGGEKNTKDVVSTDTETIAPVEGGQRESSNVVGEPQTPANGETGAENTTENTEDLNDIMNKLQST